MTAGAVRAMVVALTGGVLAAASALAASAAGGESIAVAPTLPIAVRVANQTQRPEYWRVELGLADQLVVDIGSKNSRFSAEVCVLHYDVNDYSSEDAPCRAYKSTYTKGQMRFIAPGPGKWILVVYGCVGCYVFRPRSSFVAYEFIARVRRYTRVILPPVRANVGRPTKLRGRVQGATGGKILITQRSAGRWVPLGTTRIRSDSSFAFTTTVYRRGVTRIAAMYAGDGSHRPSSGTTTVTIR